MAIEKARKHLEKWNVEHRIREFEASSATVELAAEAIGCETGKIAKSLSFLLEQDSILIVAAGDAKVDGSKFKMQFGKKAKMIAAEEVLDRIGHEVGGVCPFGINENVKTYLDVSLKRFEKVFPACGSSNSVIELTIDELEKFSNCNDWVDVCKNWQ